jgi:peroxiredoxin
MRDRWLCQREYPGPNTPVRRAGRSDVNDNEAAMDTGSAPVPPPLPAGLPVPVDDGAAEHLSGIEIPSVRLESTDGTEVNVGDLAAGRLVLYVFPRIGRPDRADPPGWDQIPGARGCTQESCAYRDLHQEFRDLGYSVAGVSAQSADEQQEASVRLHLPFALLSDPERRLGDAIGLPTFEAAGMTLYKRLTLVAREHRIVQVFYPIFPPQDNAGDVLSWIRST